MGRTPNDDRSDSMNPNNPAYAASQSNHAWQTGRDDDDDYSGYVAPAWRGSSSMTPRQPDARPECVVSVTMDLPAEQVEGLYFVYLSESEKIRGERKIKVACTSIDEAIREALAVWEGGALTFMALYDDKATYLERARDCRWSDEQCGELASVDDLVAFVAEADRQQAKARASIDKCHAEVYRPDISGAVTAFGASRAAFEALGAELAARLAALGRDGIAVTAASLPPAAKAARQALGAAACRRWIADYQQGRIRLDPIMAALGSRSRISELRI